MMADFGAFDGSTNLEEDPAAAFLAKEQQDLAGLDEDGTFATNGSFNSGHAMNGDAKGLTGENDFFDDFQQEPHTNGNGLDDGQEEVYGDEKSDDGDELHGFSAIASMDKHMQEPEKIKRWREDYEKRLQEKDAEEERKKKEWRDGARKELDDWYRNYDEQVEKTKANNRIQNAAAEKEFVQQLEETTPGGEWERIARLCDFNPKNSKNTKDTSRMRSILLQLKQHGLKSRRTVASQ